MLEGLTTAMGVEDELGQLTVAFLVGGIGEGEDQIET